MKEKTAFAFTDSVVTTFYESARVSLVSAFEKEVFAKYRSSYGEIKSVINKHAVNSFDYYHSRERLVNDKIENLAGILGLLEGIIDRNLYEKLAIIKDHRNYIAHGKRDSKPPSVEYSIDEIAVILDYVISEIEK